MSLRQWIFTHTPNFNPIRPAVSELQTQTFFKFNDGVCSARSWRRPAPDTSETSENCADGSLATYQIWARSAKQFPSYGTVKSSVIPSLSTCHALHLTLKSVEVGSAHGRKNVATHKRKPFVKRTCDCWDISLSKPWPRLEGRSYWLFSDILRDKRSRLSGTG